MRTGPTHGVPVNPVSGDRTTLFFDPIHPGGTPNPTATVVLDRVSVSTMPLLAALR